MKKGEWTPIACASLNTVSEVLIKKTDRIKKYAPNSAHTITHEIGNLLTPEERNY